MVPIGLNTPKKHPKRNPFRSGGVVLLSLILRCVGGYSSIHTNTPDFAHKVHLPHLAKRASVAGYIPDPAPVQRNSCIFHSIQKSKCPKRNPSCGGAINVIGGDIGILFTLQLLVGLVFAPHFYDGVFIDAEVAGF